MGKNRKANGGVSYLFTHSVEKSTIDIIVNYSVTYLAFFLRDNKYPGGIF